MKSIARFIVAVWLVAGVMLSMMSCGSQRMGCPGSISKTEQKEPARS